MALTDPVRATIWEDGGGTMMARVVGADATNINQAAITGIDVAVFDLNGATPDTAVHTAALVIANVVFNALQTDARWTEDSTGYNFRDTQAASVFATGGHRYRVEYEFDPVTGENFWIVYELDCRPVKSS